MNPEWCKSYNQSFDQISETTCGRTPGFRNFECMLGEICPAGFWHNYFKYLQDIWGQAWDATLYIFEYNEGYNFSKKKYMIQQMYQSPRKVYFIIVQTKKLFILFRIDLVVIFCIIQHDN